MLLQVIGDRRQPGVLVHAFYLRDERTRPRTF